MRHPFNTIPAFTYVFDRAIEKWRAGTLEYSLARPWGESVWFAVWEYMGERYSSPALNFPGMVIPGTPTADRLAEENASRAAHLSYMEAQAVSDESVSAFRLSDVVPNLDAIPAFDPISLMIGPAKAVLSWAGSQVAALLPKGTIEKMGVTITVLGIAAIVVGGFVLWRAVK